MADESDATQSFGSGPSDCGRDRIRGDGGASHRDKGRSFLDGRRRAITFAPSGDAVVAPLASLRKRSVVAINATHLDRIPEFDYDHLLWGERWAASMRR